MAYTRMYRVRTVAIGYMTDPMGRMHSDAQFAGMTLPAQRQTQRHPFEGVSFFVL